MYLSKVTKYLYFVTFHQLSSTSCVIWGIIPKLPNFKTLQYLLFWKTTIRNQCD